MYSYAPMYIYHDNYVLDYQKKKKKKKKDTYALMYLFIHDTLCTSCFFYYSYLLVTWFCASLSILECESFGRNNE